MCYGACIKFRLLALLNISGRIPLGELLATGLPVGVIIESMRCNQWVRSVNMVTECGQRVIDILNTSL